MTGQVTDVNKNLALFPKMVEQGLEIILSKSKEAISQMRNLD